MALLIHSGYSSYEVLSEELPEQLNPKPNQIKDLSRMRIGLVNLMPDKDATERQWFRLFAKAPFAIEPVLIQMNSRISARATAQSNSPYVSADWVEVSKLDAIVFTGAPVEHLNFEEVDYWEELSDLHERCLGADVKILGVCWAAQALLFRRFGIEKVQLPHKCFGIFHHQVKAETLAQWLGESLFLPHSRHTAWPEDALIKHPCIQTLITSDEAGSFAIADELGHTYFTGHMEYEADTLLQEYFRDLDKGIDIEAPSGYVKNTAGHWEATVHWQASAERIATFWLSGVLDSKAQQRRWGA